MLITSTSTNGAISNDSNNNITISVANTTIANVNSSGIYFESGKKAIYTGAVLQVVQAVKTDTQTGATGDVWTDITGLSASITPTSSSSKILIFVDVKGSGNAGNSIVRTRLLRNSTAIYIGDAASNRPRVLSQFYIGIQADNIHYMAQLGGTFVDSPGTTSSTTYKVQVGSDGNDRVYYINRTQGDRDNAYYDSRAASSITLMEIAV